MAIGRVALTMMCSQMGQEQSAELFLGRVGFRQGSNYFVRIRVNLLQLVGMINRQIIINRQPLCHRAVAEAKLKD